MRALSISVALALAFIAGCGKDAAKPADAGVVDAASGPDASCFTNPQTHYEIINACTTAPKIYKTTRPPLLNADGSLPPLP